MGLFDVASKTAHRRVPITMTKHLLTQLLTLVIAVALSKSVSAQQPSPDATWRPAAAEDTPRPWLLVPVFSSSPNSVRPSADSAPSTLRDVPVGSWSGGECYYLFVG